MPPVTLDISRDLSNAIRFLSIDSIVRMKLDAFRYRTDSPTVTLQITS
jgi:hypothetical protein